MQEGGEDAKAKASNVQEGSDAVVSVAESPGGAAKRRKVDAAAAQSVIADPYEPFWAYFALYGEDLGQSSTNKPQQHAD